MVAGQERGLGTEGTVTALETVAHSVHLSSLHAGHHGLVLETGVQSDDPPFQGGHTPE